MPDSEGQLPVGVTLVPTVKPGWRQRVTAAWHALTRRPTWLLGLAGLALLAASVVRVIGISSTGGLVTVVVAGAVLLISPFIIARVQRFSVSSSGFELQLAQSVADLGAPKAARILDRTDLAKFAESYAFVHTELEDHRYYDAKIHLQDLLVERAAAMASSEKFDATEVRTLFAKAAPTMRVLALGLMQGDLSLADGPAVLSAVADPRSANEQLQGLKLARLCWRRLPRSDRAALKYVIRTDPDIEAGANRRQAAQQVLDLPDSPEGPVLGA
jgi:hypothetical protein